ncbi:MAG: VOC family protein [Actinomycetota bacterium]|nr:VOC family protein [Actinomycetota bacterium]MDK1027615.1 VOC family protein [Actinomycetota bacterium]MDK1038349.1 VOC family protein [Actinomycetota bacterium]MDK1097419.1 VOC family protein [Actinomycetota bacterium]MDK1103059.1 VOC family protein [Actinomycetota bacterium]
MLRFVDHLVFATPDLDEGIRLIERVFDAHVTPGGRHKHWGTRNALVSLGETTYLEIIGPDPERSTRETPHLFRIDQIDEPRLVTWAAKGANLSGIVASARSRGVDLGDISQGSRLLPDGTELRWRLTDPYAERVGGVIPFFVDWGETTHPATALPSQCELITVNLEHPHPEQAERAMRAVGITTQVAAGDTSQIRATIRTPNGIVELT